MGSTVQLLGRMGRRRQRRRRRRRSEIQRLGVDGAWMHLSPPERPPAKPSPPIRECCTFVSSSISTTSATLRSTTVHGSDRGRDIVAAKRSASYQVSTCNRVDTSKYHHGVLRSVAQKKKQDLCDVGSLRRKLALRPPRHTSTVSVGINRSSCRPNRHRHRSNKLLFKASHHSITNQE